MITQKQQIETAWENAKTVAGKNPDKYRQDSYGNLMFRYSYGKTSHMGWEVVHVIPPTRGDYAATMYLQALSTSMNRNTGVLKRQ